MEKLKKRVTCVLFEVLVLCRKSRQLSRLRRRANRFPRPLDLSQPR